MSIDLLFFLEFHLSFLSIDLLFLSQLNILKFICLFDFFLSKFFIMSLLFSHHSNFFFFKDLHSGMFKCFATKDFENWFNWKIEVEKVEIFNLSTEVFSRLHWHSIDWCWLFNFKIILNSNFIMRSFICKFFNKLISLNLNMFSSCKSWFLSDISNCVLICVSELRLGFLFWIHGISHLSSWNDHWSMSQASTNSSIMHDVLWLILLGLSIRIFILSLLSNNSRSRRKVCHLLI